MVKSLLKYKNRLKKKDFEDEEDDETTFPFVQKLIENKTFKLEIKNTIKYLEDPSLDDNFIIDYIARFVNTNEEARGCFQFCQYGNDNISLLHFAAKHCRPFVCDFLIDELFIDVNIQTKSRMTPLHFLIKYNPIKLEFQKNQEQIQTLADESKEEHDQAKDIKETKANDSKKDRKKSDQSLKQAIDEYTKLKFQTTFEMLIQKGASINHQDEQGLTPLHHAAQNDNYQAALMLIQFEHINLEIEENSHLTPLHIACENGFEDLACLLIDKLNIEALTNQTNPTLPIHLACKNRFETKNIVKKTLDRIKFEAPDELINVLTKLDEKKQSLLNIAIENNHLNIIDLLLKDYYKEGKDNEDKNGNLPIHLAAKSGSLDILNILIKNEAVSFNNNSNGDNALHIAAENNKFNFIREFLAYEKQYVHKYKLEETHIPLAKCLNRSNYSPLFLAVLGGHTKCVEILVMLDEVELDLQDKDGNSIYHICAQYNNFESLRFCLTRKEGNRFLKPLYLRNNREETVIHTASRYENLEIIKLALSKIYDGSMPTEVYLQLKNTDGDTFFHIACKKGYFNVVEYFLKDLKMKFLIETPDIHMNTPLHLASERGHLSIANILIDVGADMQAKNKDDHTPLELSCRKGYFEVSKVLINRYPKMTTTEETVKDDPLHVASSEGAFEVVRLLLSKGAQIDTLNNENKNCLDIAIEKGHREVIKALLENQNSFKLFMPEKTEINAETKHTELILESPQLNALYENKMWDMIKIVLDNCQNENDFDFVVLDPAKCTNINTHPLMLLAKSGQETLLKHDTTLMLLNLKWRFIPRFVYYSNLFLYLVYLILFCIYCLQIQMSYDDAVKENPVIGDDYKFIYADDPSVQNIPYLNSDISIYLLIILGFISLKTFMQIVFITRLSFFSSITDWIEIFTYVMTLATILTTDPNAKFSFASIAILSAFLVFAFLIEKLQVFGLFVLAFKKTLIKSATFLPVFLVIYAGFNMSFRLRSQFGVSYYNTTDQALSISKTFSMVMGDFSASDMGLEKGTIVNYILYILFICVMPIIVLNMLVGIAVGEISTILSEADIQQISMRIIFVMKCQDVLKRLAKKPSLKKYLSLRFEKYTYRDEYTLIKIRDKFYEFVSKTFSSKEPEIKLDDPQKRLEENLTELARITNDDMKKTREMLTNHITDVATKLGNAQQRLEDSLLENARKSTNNIESSQDNSSSQLQSVENNLISSQNQIKFMLRDLHRNTNTKLVGLKNAFKTRFQKLEIKFLPPQKDLEENVGKLFKQTGNIIRISNVEFKNLTNILNGIVDKMNQFLEINKSLCNQVDSIQKVTDGLVVQMDRFQAANNDLLGQVNDFQSVNTSLASKINGLQAQIDKMNYEIRDLTKNVFISTNRTDSGADILRQTALNTASTSAASANAGSSNIPENFEVKYQIIKEQEIRESSGSEDD